MRVQKRNSLFKGESTKQHGQLLVENILQFWLEVKLNKLFSIVIESSVSKKN